MEELSIRYVFKARDVPQHLWSEGFPPPTEGQYLYELLEDSGLENQVSFRYAVVEDKGQAVALAPVFTANMPIERIIPYFLVPFCKPLTRLFPSLFSQTTLFVGSSDAEESHIGVLKPYSRATILLALAKEMERLAQELNSAAIIFLDFPDHYKTDFQALLSQGFIPTRSLSRN